MVKWGLGYTDAEVTESDEVVNGDPLKGTTPVNTPEWATSLMFSYTQPVSENLVLECWIAGNGRTSGISSRRAVRISQESFGYDVISG